ncbi:Calcium/calmodulin-dependent protein kinase protein [Dioscorea alata]|uniref:Calcium/calmodulin-dependent protein kinase protein n=1 Tax=Dioscorea alata TaxID=55571 RepID=A0ACB7VPC6_DIOAL|nr:Calcium/calmodulin-dependent protein kinase protein [Dioscorea alata]
MEDDDWGLSAEQLDFLEEDAIRKISEKKASINPVKCSKSDGVPPTGVSSSDALKGAESKNTLDLPKFSVRLYLHHTGVIAAKFSYNTLLVDAIRKVPRASWLGKERLWVFPISSLTAAKEVFSQIPHAVVEVHGLDPSVHRAVIAASAVPDLQGLYDTMPSYLESKLLPFQKDGVRFMLQHGGRALLADEMGLGKTLQAIAFTACIRDSWPVLILTPSSLRLHWASMVQQWLNIPAADILVVLSQYGGSNKAGFYTVYLNKTGTTNLDGVFNILSYDAVPKLQNILLSSEFKIVIADESHFLKNAQAKRTSASVPILQQARYAILLSGTPALSRPIELFKQLAALYPDVYKNVHEYGNRYCKGGVFGLYQGASNHEELHNLMKATVMIRRLKKDVLSELPVKRRQQVFLDLDEKDIKQIRFLLRELEVIKSKIQASQSSEEVESLKISQRTLINKIYNDSAQAKIPAVHDYLGTVIEAGCKFLIFAHHQPMIDSIHQFLIKKKVACIRIDGSTPSSSRQALVTDFQEKDSIRAAVLSIKAAGVGLTLTAATTVIFAELSWTPGDIIQAEDRAHRIGQVSSVNIYYLLANDTVDDIIWDVVQSKLENLGQFLDGEENTLEVSKSETSSSSPAKQGTLDTYLKRCRNGADTLPEAKKPK